MSFVYLESSHKVIKRVISDVVWFLAVCTDHSSVLAQKCSRSNAVFLPTVFLHVARILNAYDEVCDIVLILFCF